MTPSDKLRKIAVKFFPTEEKLSNNSLYNQLQQSSQDKLFSDLTALISEDYYPKEFVEWYVAEVSNDRARIYPYCYMIWVDGTGIGFDTFDELFNYWRENEQ